MNIANQFYLFNEKLKNFHNIYFNCIVNHNLKYKIKYLIFIIKSFISNSNLKFSFFLFI